MALVQNFRAVTSSPNEIALTWAAPANFNTTDDEIIVTRTITHFPMELFNTNFPNRATEPRAIEIFRGKTIVGTNTGTISVSGSTLTDTSAAFPNVKGRLLRDATSKIHRIIDFTSTSITVEGTPANGKYIILPDFNTTTRTQENFEVDIRTEAGSGFIDNLVKSEEGSLTLKEFVEGELNNLLFKDGNGTIFLIKNNTSSKLSFYSSNTPVIGPGMSILNSHFESTPLPYIDTFRTESEASNREGSQLLDDQFYYYTTFTKGSSDNVAQSEFGTFSTINSTQDFALSTKDTDFGGLLYELWPTLHRQLDESGDLEDLMSVFGFQFNEIHSLIKTYNLQDPDNVLVTAALPLSEQTGLPSVGYSIGADTLRRIAAEMISCWKLKGSKEGIALFIRKLTTWDITNGTADFGGAIEDFLPNVEALRFFDPNLGTLNTRITQTDPFVAGGRFARSLPGVVIPGFFTFREFVIDIPDVALFIGETEDFTVGTGTTMEDTSANFGGTNNLVGNFLLPNTEEVNDIFEIVANTTTTITVRGLVNNRVPGGDYVVLSPLNTNRFIILNKLLPVYIPFGTRPGFTFSINP